MMLSNGVGQSIPSDTAHAVSVSLPTWKANVGYEEGEDWVLSKMKTGYPRFFIHKSIQSFAEAIVQRYGTSGEEAFLFPTRTVSDRCVAFFRRQDPRPRANNSLRIVDLVLDLDQVGEPQKDKIRIEKAIISAVVFPKQFLKIAKTFWQHSGEGISSRRAEYCRKAFDNGYLSVRESAETESQDPTLCKGPRRYQKKLSVEVKNFPKPGEEYSHPQPSASDDFVQFVEERFGRNLDVTLATNAKKAIRRRIAGALGGGSDHSDPIGTDDPASGFVKGRSVSEDDVYLYPCGMSSIFNAHRSLLQCRGEMKSVNFGFPYIDTLKILEKWGPGCIFYGHGISIDLDDLEDRCQRGEKFLALFCEFPGNPLLKAPDLVRIRGLANQYDFAVVVDETIGNFVNVDVLPYADIVVSSLTKVFTGECNVMGGSTVLNSQSRYYHQIKNFMSLDYEDNYWPEDAIFMERNSRDFISRVHRINANAEMICDVLKTSPNVKEIYYPKCSPTRSFYEQCRNENGGYGGLLSATFHSTTQAVHFFDQLNTAKGPSLGTNFTLSSPYVILAHYGELDWARQFGVNPDLIRVSVGLEDPKELRSIFEHALAATQTLGST